ncbi:MAG: hypothetical protein ACXWCY_14535 [Burkholderiales bacterium]
MGPTLTTEIRVFRHVYRRTEMRLGHVFRKIEEQRYDLARRIGMRPELVVSRVLNEQGFVVQSDILLAKTLIQKLTEFIEDHLTEPVADEPLMEALPVHA